MMTKDEVPSVNPKIDAMGEILKTIHNLNERNKTLEKQLTKAKDHIKRLLSCLQQDTNDPQTNYYVVKYMNEAEQFLKE